MLNDVVAVEAKVAPIQLDEPFRRNDGAHSSPVPVRTIIRLSAHSSIL
jgi:hypothetical protein